MNKIIKIATNVIFSQSNPKICAQLYLSNAIPFFQQIQDPTINNYDKYGQGIILEDFLLDSGYSGKVIIKPELADKLKIRNLKPTYQYLRSIDQNISENEVGNFIFISLFNPLNVSPDKNKNYLTAKPLIKEGHNIIGLKGLEDLNIELSIEEKFAYYYDKQIEDISYFNTDDPRIRRKK